MKNLSRTELKIILEVLTEGREARRESCVEVNRRIPTRTDDPDYFALVDLQRKLADHLEKLPY